jgi:hypothetical protein
VAAGDDERMDPAMDAPIQKQLRGFLENRPQPAPSPHAPEASPPKSIHDARPGTVVGTDIFTEHSGSFRAVTLVIMYKFDNRAQSGEDIDQIRIMNIMEVNDVRSFSAQDDLHLYF